VTFDHVPFWQAEGFQDRIAAWIAQEQPGVDLIPVVIAWIEQQLDDPYRGVHRETTVAPNLWWARIPRTFHDGSDVLCSYWINEDLRTVRCNSIVTLSRPN
jgi:hypothetical protein